MPSTSITTIIKMMESLPESVQSQVVEHLREYIEDMQDELEWDASFNKTETQLRAAAKKAKKEIEEGKAKPMDYDQL